MGDEPGPGAPVVGDAEDAIEGAFVLPEAAARRVALRRLTRRLPLRMLGVLGLGALVGLVVLGVALGVLWGMTEHALPRMFGRAFTELEGEARLTVTLAFAQVFGGFAALWAAGVVGGRRRGLVRDRPVPP